MAVQTSKRLLQNSGNGVALGHDEGRYLSSLQLCYHALQDLVPLLSEKAIKCAEHDNFLIGLWTVRSSKQTQ